MTRPEDFKELHPAVKSLLENGFDGFLESLQILLNEAMRAERSLALEAAPYERNSNRKGYANGYKPKRMMTRNGIIDLEVPQVRDGISFYPSCLERGLRSERTLNLAIAEMYLQGVSTRKVSKVMEHLLNEGISSDKVSRIAKSLDDELEKWRERPLGKIKFMYVDARYENVRVDGMVRSCALLLAIGIRDDGRRSILGTSVSLSEAEIHWREFLKSLQKRGLHGLEMITSDDHKGLKQALKSVFNGVKWQRCQYHLQNNALHHVTRQEYRKEAALSIKSIFNAPDIDEAKRLYEKAMRKYEKKIPKLCTWMEDNIHESLTVFALPEAWRKKLRTSNPLERLNKEFKRRTRVIEIFPNEASLLRLASAIAREKSEEWESGKKYLSMDS